MVSPPIALCQALDGKTRNAFLKHTTNSPDLPSNDLWLFPRLNSKGQKLRDIANEDVPVALHVTARGEKHRYF
jgi:hypothetical protein